MEVTLSVSGTSTAKQRQEVLVGSNLIPRRGKTQEELRRKRRKSENGAWIGHLKYLRGISIKNCLSEPHLGINRPFKCKRMACANVAQICF